MDDIVLQSDHPETIFRYSGSQQSPKQRKNGSQGISAELGLNATRKWHMEWHMEKIGEGITMGSQNSH